MKELFSSKSFDRHVTFSYGALSNNWQKSESLSFRFSPLGEFEIFCLKRYAFPKNVSRTRRIRFWQSYEKLYIKFSVFFQYNCENKNSLKYTFLESKHAYSDYNPMDTSNTAFETPPNFLNWVSKFRLSGSEKKWWE